MHEFQALSEFWRMTWAEAERAELKEVAARLRGILITEGEIIENFKRWRAGRQE